MKLNDITGAVVDEAIGIHRDLGGDLFESVYEMLLAAALEQRGLRVDRQRPINFSYKNIHTKQILTYMRLANLHVGLILNCGAETMSKGIKRFVRDLPP